MIICWDHPLQVFFRAFSLCALAQTAIKDAINKWEEKSAEDPAEATKVPCAFLPGAFPPRQSASSARQLLMLVLDR